MKKINKLNDEVIFEIINIISKCFYISIELFDTSFKILNSTGLVLNKIENPFHDKKMNPNKLRELLIHLIQLNAKRYAEKYAKQQASLAIKKDNTNSIFQTRKDNLYQKVYDYNYSMIINEMEYWDFNTISYHQNNLLLTLFLSKRAEIVYCSNMQEFIKQEALYKKRILNLRTFYNSFTKDEYDINFTPNSIFYRGNKLNYDLSPSLYRNNFNPELEHILNNRIIQNMPNAFLGCDSLFDKLVILKHFNCPSRLLDITKNPLIAAFFALDNYSQNSASRFGAINCCSARDISQIKNSNNSDSISLLSALATTNKNLPSFDSNFIYKKTKELLKIIKNKNRNNNDLNKIIKIYDNLVKNYTKENCLSFYLSGIHKELQELLSHKKLTIEIIDSKISDSLIELKSKIKTTKFFNSELQHQATIINPEFNIFTPRNQDIDNYYFVYPSLNNPRIVNQQGIFIIVGSSLNYFESYLNPNIKYLDRFSNYEDKRLIFIIDNHNNQFYENLDKTFGINKAFVYPELEKKVNQINNDVMFEYGIDKNK